MHAPLPPDESELLAEMKRDWIEQLRFFSNPAKGERERWVVNEFLVHRGIACSDSELRSHHQASPVDVEFREARFQVKEITDPNLRRSKEIKTTYQRVVDAKTLQETVGPGFVYDVPPPVCGYTLVHDAARTLAGRVPYRAHRSQLDLLFYITRTRTSPIAADQVRLDEMASIGWRSISCLVASQAMVLCASPASPVFLQEATFSGEQRRTLGRLHLADAMGTRGTA